MSVVRKPYQTLVETVVFRLIISRLVALKFMLLRVLIFLCALLSALTACTNGPVFAPVRDTSQKSAPEIPETSISTIPEKKPQFEPGEPFNPIAPNTKPAPSTIPLSSELKKQSEKSLQYEQWNQAILLAERGLRIDRKEAFFYWVLAKAYQQLFKTQQSIEFARQGLRYVSNNEWLKSQLMSLSNQ